MSELIWKIIWPFPSSWDGLGKTKRGTTHISRIILSKKEKKILYFRDFFLSHYQTYELTVALNLDNPRQVGLYALRCDSCRAQTFSPFASKLICALNMNLLHVCASFEFVPSCMKMFLSSSRIYLLESLFPLLRNYCPPWIHSFSLVFHSLLLLPQTSPERNRIHLR